MHIKTVGSYEAKTHLSSLLDSVAQGEKIIITRKGMPIAVLMPYKENNTCVSDTISAILQLRQEQSLDNLSIEEMKNSGRRF